MNRPTPRAARALPLALALGALGAGAAALARQDAPATEAYTLQRAYKKGDVDRYKSSLTAKINSPLTGNMEVEMAMVAVAKETTKEVKPDGSGVLLREFEQMYVRSGEQEFDLTESQPKITQTQDRVGRILESKSAGGAGEFANVSEAFGIAQAAFYPDKPVKVGDTWKIPAPAEAAKKAKVSLTGDSRLEGRETHKGAEVFRIKSTADVLVERDASKFRIDGFALIEAKTGRIVKMDATFDGNLGKSGPVKAKFTLDLLTDADKAAPKKPEDKK